MCIHQDFDEIINTEIIDKKKDKKVVHFYPQNLFSPIKQPKHTNPASKIIKPIPLTSNSFAPSQNIIIEQDLMRINMRQQIFNRLTYQFRYR
jgi:hypothetical protein